MKFPSLRQPPKRQSFWRAVAAAVLAQSIVVIALGMVYWAVRPFVWAAIYMDPYQPPPAPYPPGSGEWLFTQAIGFCASVAAGVMAAYWSPPKSYLPMAVLIALNFDFVAFTQFPLDTSPFRNGIYALEIPLGLMVGAVLLRRWQAKGEGGAQQRR